MISNWSNQAELAEVAALSARNEPAATVEALRAEVARQVDLDSFREQPRVIQYARLSRLHPAVVERACMLSLAYGAVSDPDSRRHVTAHLVQRVAREYPEAVVPATPDQVWRWYDGEARCLAFGARDVPGIGVEAAYRYLRANMMLLSLADAPAEVLHEQLPRLEVWRFRSVRQRSAPS